MTYRAGVFCCSVAAICVYFASCTDFPAIKKVHIDMSYVQEKARELALGPFRPGPSLLSPQLISLDYEHYRRIRFRNDKSLWRSEHLPFEVQFFHPGYRYPPVAIREFTATHRQVVRFAPEFFEYPPSIHVSDLPGYAGFRIHYPINRPDYKDEIISFLGASYFRALGRNQWYGSSARGLAINTAEFPEEEFPSFTQFWIQKPGPDEKHIIVYALLDGPSVAGAYEFAVVPGVSTRIDVRATLYFRKTVALVGVAPLTSMFWFGENSGTTFGDFRPEVHDADGLMIESSSGERIWRPLVNERRNRFSVFRASGIRSFGLYQRDRTFQNYEDFESHYERRPSIRVTPKGDWGSGSVRLFEFATADETNDNIVALWQPDKSPEVRKPYDVAYTMDWMMEGETASRGGYVRATRTGSVEGHGNSRRFVLDFAGTSLQQLADGEPVEAAVSATGGVISNTSVQRNPYDRSWRVVFQVDAVKAPVELHCFLKRRADTLTETWTYQWNP